MSDTLSIEGRLLCDPSNEEMLGRIAESVDKFVGEYPRLGGYDLSASVSVILNHGTHEQIEAAFGLLSSWQFEPKGGW